MVDEKAVRLKYQRAVPATAEELTRAHAKAGRRYWAPELRAEIFKRYRAGEKPPELAIEYGTTRGAIWGIIDRERRGGWRVTAGKKRQPLEEPQRVDRVKGVTLARIYRPTLSEQE